MSDLFDEFIDDARQQIEAIEDALLTMARDPQPAAIQACFRALHTVKGNSGFFDLPRIQILAHTAEQVLDAIRTDRVPCDGDRVDLLLEALTLLTTLVEALTTEGAEPAGDDQALLERLASAAQTAGSTSGTQAIRIPTQRIAKPAAVNVVEEPAGEELSRHDLVTALVTLQPGDTANLLRHLDALKGRLDDVSDRARDRFCKLDDLAQLLVLGLVDDLRQGWADFFSQIGEFHSACVGEAGGTPATSEAGLEDFVAEAEELVAVIEQVALDGKDDVSGDGLAEVRRQVHTIKGLASGVRCANLREACHRLEDKIDAVLGASGGVDRQGLLLIVDDFRGILPRIVAERGDGSITGNDLARRLDAAPTTKTAPATTPAPAKVAPTRPAVEAGKPKAATGDGTARVSTGRLDDLMNLVGELIIAHSMVTQMQGEVDANMGQAISRQGRIIRELQNIALGLRMVPLRSSFQKLTRVVHDTSRKLDKQIDLVVEGEETEIDRTLAETIADPLMHMVRNAVDHGVEDAATRRSAGKREIGSIRLSARQTTDFVEICLEDDGKGLDPDKLRAKALEKGIIAPDQVLSDDQARELIFAPGFSTAVQVTDVSGRGVGMDVVRRNIESVNGRIEIRSQVGKGSSFVIRLPLTTAIIDAMLVRLRGERFLVPVNAVIEILNPDRKSITRILNSQRVIESRNRILPVVDLASSFSIPGETDPDAPCVLVIVDGPDRQIALLVDEVIGQQQVVVKPIDRRIGYAKGLTGSAILGDGRIGLIVDPTQLSRTELAA